MAPIHNRYYTAAEMELLYEFLGHSEEKFTKLRDAAEAMLIAWDCPMHKEQLRHAERCLGVIRQLRTWIVHPVRPGGRAEGR